MAKGKTIGIILAVVLVFALVGGFLFTEGFGTLSVFGACSGGQVLSVDDVSIRTSSDLGGKQVIRVLFSSLPSAECLDIRVSQSQIRNELNRDDFQVTDSIVGDIRLTKKSIEYGVNVRSTEKFIRFGEFDVDGGGVCEDSDCRTEMSARGIPTSSLISSVNVGGFLIFGGTCTCVFDDIRGINGAYTSGSTLKWEADVSVGGGEVTLSNSKISGKIGNDVFVKWAGNLAGNTGFSRPDKDAMQSINTNQFSMIDDGVYNELNRDRTPINSFLISAGQPGSHDGEEALDALRDYNARFDQLTRNILGSWVNDETFVADAFFSGSKLIIDLDSPIIYPQFTLDIDAEEVGIFITQGEPDVSCPSNFDIISGGSFNARVNVKNKGSASGAFSFFVDCNGGSQTISPSGQVNIGAGGSRTVIVTSGGISESGTERVACRFTAIEVNTGEEDSCSFAYDVEFRESCTSGQKSCELGNSELWECIGSGEFEKFDCSFGCEAFGSSFRCRLQPSEVCDNGIDDNGDGLIDDEDPLCKKGIGGFFRSIGNWFSNLFAGIFGVFYAIKLLFIIIGLIFVTLFSKALIATTKALGDNVAVQWILAIIIGVMFAVFLFLFIGGFFFWILLIAGLISLGLLARVRGALDEN